MPLIHLTGSARLPPRAKKIRYKVCCQALSLDFHHNIERGCRTVAHFPSGMFFIVFKQTVLLSHVYEMKEF
jgi:hypothetical protein